jgi:hypothetical protein
MQALHGVRWAYQDMAMEKNLNKNRQPMILPAFTLWISFRISNPGRKHSAFAVCLIL